MYVPGMGARPFPFATVMPGSTSQKSVYEKAGRPMLVGALNGFRTCITCYGQTGSGKTHTLFGPPEVIDFAGALPVPVWLYWYIFGGLPVLTVYR